MLVSLGCDPTVQRDHADNLQSRVGQRAFQLGDASPLLQICGDLVVPRLDRLVAGFAGDRYLFQKRRRPDRARVQAVDELAHRCDPLSGPFVSGPPQSIPLE